MTTGQESPTGVLAEMTIDEVEALDPEVVVLGLGSTEPHGPHLPYGTDVYQTEAVCRRAVSRANERDARALSYPTFPIGNNVNFKGYPFACRIRVRTLMNVVLDVIAALEEEGVRKVVLVNGHGGNTATLKATVREHRGRKNLDEGAFVCLTSTNAAIPDDIEEQIEHPSDHGGESETSRMLHLHPELVDEEALENFPVREPRVEQLAESGAYFVPPWPGYLPESAGGETRASSAEKGAALVDGAADWIADLIVALHESTVDELFPYSGDGR
jgi:creatinine amidohydrolase